MMQTMKRVLAVFAVCALGSCAGGGGGAHSLPASPSTPAPAVAAPTATPMAMTSARFTITVPSAPAPTALGRKPAYISPSTQSVIITLVSVNG